MEPQSYGRLICRARNEAGIKQQDLADAIGITRETLSRWERDKLKVTPSAEELNRLLQQLPTLTEVQLLHALGYKLSPLVDPGGQLRGPPGRVLAKSPDEERLLANYRKLRPVLQRVVQRQLGALIEP